MNYGHQLGLCYEKDGIAYVPVHKNASTWIIKYLTGLSSRTSFGPVAHRGWNQTNVGRVKKNCKFVVVLRPDIIERWVSGICEVFLHTTRELVSAEVSSQLHVDQVYHLLLDHEYIDNIFKKITFECHTDLQSNIVTNIPSDQIIFFNLSEPGFQDSFTALIGNKEHIPISSKFQPMQFNNISANFDHKTSIINKFTEYTQEEKYNAMLKDHFAKDFELVRNVEFCN